MNVFNRFVVVVAAIITAVAGLILAIVPESLLRALQRWTVGAMVTPSDRIASTVLGVALFVIAVSVIYLNLRRRRKLHVVVKRLSDGAVSIQVDSVAQRLRQDVEGLQGVRQVTPEVHSLGRTVAVKVLVVADDAVDIPTKAEEIGNVVRETIAKMGIGLARQSVSLRYDQAAPSRAARQL